MLISSNMSDRQSRRRNERLALLQPHLERAKPRAATRPPRVYSGSGIVREQTPAELKMTERVMRWRKIDPAK
jgi:hypothetical protein